MWHIDIYEFCGPVLHRVPKQKIENHSIQH